MKSWTSSWYAVYAIVGLLALTCALLPLPSRSPWWAHAAVAAGTTAVVLLGVDRLHRWRLRHR